MVELRLNTLRGQLALIVGLLLGSVAVAVLVATQRAFFEKQIHEQYRGLAASLLPVAEAASRGCLDGIPFAKLSPEERLALYDDWMSRPVPPPEGTPRSLVAADPGLYLGRAERTLVCGSPEQRTRALLFLELSRSKQAIPILQRALAWAQRRKQSELGAGIGESAERLAESLREEPMTPAALVP